MVVSKEGTATSSRTDPFSASPRTVPGKTASQMRATPKHRWAAADRERLAGHLDRVWPDTGPKPTQQVAAGRAILPISDWSGNGQSSRRTESVGRRLEPAEVATFL